MKKSLLFLISFLIIPTLCFGGVDFDKTDDYLNCQSPASLDNLTTYTVCATYKLDTAPAGGNWSDIFSKYVTTGSIPMEIASGREALMYWNSSGTDMLVVTSTLISTGVWTRQCNTFDNSGDRKGRVYFSPDGTEASYTTQNAATGTLDSDAGNNAEIGRGVGAARFFDGTIAEVNVWGSVLPNHEIVQYIKSNEKNIALQLSTSTLVAVWGLDDAPDGTSADGIVFKDLKGTNDCTGDNGGNNTGLTAKAEEVASYP